MSDIMQPHGRRRTSAWLPIVLGAVAFVVVLVGFGAASADWFTRNSEMNRLVTAIEASEDAMGWTQDHIAAVFAQTEGSGELTDEQRAEIDASLKTIVGEGRERITAAGVDVAEVGVLPWHTRILDAQRAYVRHNEAWQEYMWLAEQDPAQLTAEQPEVNDSFMAAEAPLKNAVPEPPLFNLEQRVIDIFVEGALQDDTEGGPTQDVHFTASSRSWTQR